MTKKDKRHLSIIYSLVIIFFVIVWAYITTCMNGRM